MQFFKSENYFEVRRRQANAATRADHYHTVANPAKGEKPGEREADAVRSTRCRPVQKTQ